MKLRVKISDSTEGEVRFLRDLGVFGRGNMDVDENIIQCAVSVLRWIVLEAMTGWSPGSLKEDEKVYRRLSNPLTDAIRAKYPQPLSEEEAVALLSKYWKDYSPG